MKAHLVSKIRLTCDNCGKSSEGRKHMPREPFKNTVTGIIFLGVIASAIANQFGAIDIQGWFRSKPEPHNVQIINNYRTAPDTSKKTIHQSQDTTGESSEKKTLQGLNQAQTSQTPTPEPTQSPQLSLTPISQPVVRKVFSAPEITDIPFKTSSWINWQGLRASVIRLREYNGMTAVTFKVDGSNNSEPYRWIPAPKRTSMSEFYTSNTNIIDQSGRRYRLLEDNPDVPEQTKYENGNYVLAPRETVFVTYLFEAIDPAARKFDVTFPEIIKDGNLDLSRLTIHVVMD
jgi:hypothetical protein